VGAPDWLKPGAVFAQHYVMQAVTQWLTIACECDRSSRTRDTFAGSRRGDRAPRMG
jgi:hypothetical protein